MKRPYSPAPGCVRGPSPRMKWFVTAAALLVAPLLAWFASEWSRSRPASAHRHRSLEEALALSERSAPDDGPATATEMNLRGLVRQSDHPELIYELKPNLDCVYRGARFQTNSHGFRDREWTIDKPAGSLRIACVGDSLLVAPWVEVDAGYARVLERLLDGEARRLEVMNFGVPGYNTCQEAALLRDRAASFSPDVVIVGYVGNDDQLPLFVAGAAGAGEPRGLVDRRDFFRDLVDLPWEAKRGLREPAPALDWRDRVPDEYRHMIGWRAVEESIRSIGDFLAERGIRGLLTLYVSDAGPAFDPNPLAERHAWLCGLAAECGLECVDLHPVFTRAARDRGFSDTRPFWVGPQNAHLNPQGHKILARAAAERLRSLGWVRR
jgi:lysophospholipase L1-like esterase